MAFTDPKEPRALPAHRPILRRITLQILAGDDVMATVLNAAMIFRVRK